jgi:hypothetical protein
VQCLDKKSDEHRIGKLYSWEILNNSVAVKTCDKSFFVHKGTGIPQEIAWFFGAEGMPPGKRSIQLTFQEVIYSATLVCNNRDGTPNLQLLWHADLGNEFKKIKGERNAYSGHARFTKVRDNEFCVTITTNKSKRITTEKTKISKSNPLATLNLLINEIDQEESTYLKIYTNALNIENTESMLKEQQRATLSIRLIKKWKAQLVQLKKEFQEHGSILTFSEEAAKIENQKNCAATEDASGVKIGKYVQERMRQLEKANLAFTDEEFALMQTEEWSKSVLRLGKPIIYLLNPNKTLNEQIKDKTGNNRYWCDTFTLIIKGFSFVVNGFLIIKSILIIGLHR